jgi:two-component system chemotaxis response regulator CheB
MIRVLVVDDSATARLALRRLLEEEGDISVVGEAATAAAAHAAVRNLKPDLVTMDVHLGDTDGVDVVRDLMASRALPILVVTGLDTGAAGLPFRVVEAGALGLAAKPAARGHEAHAREAGRLRRLVRSLAVVPVVTRRPPPSSAGVPRTSTAVRASLTPVADGVLVIGASTGGPQALHAVLSALPAPFPWPIVIAQHIEPGFVVGLAEWLSSSGHDVAIAREAAPLAAGRVWLAADGAHVGLVGPRTVGPIVDDTAAHVPSVDALLRTAAVCRGADVVAMVLGGMGQDGLRGAADVRRRSGVVFAQSRDSCVVDGMPGAILDAGLATLSGAPSTLAAAVRHLALARLPLSE